MRAAASLELAFPPVRVQQELLHVLCKADDVAEFLASAHAWLMLLDHAPGYGSSDEAWDEVQAAHDAALASVFNADWRARLLARLEDTLFENARYRAHWEQLRRVVAPLRATVH